MSYSQMHSLPLAFEEYAQHFKDDDWSEGAWELFFRKNTWIFGYGLAYQFLSEIQKQPHYGGTSLAGTGGQRGDFLMATAAQARFTVLVDIKKPSSPLIGQKYRSQVYEMGREFVGAISQLQSNCRTWVTSGSLQQANVEDLAVQGISTFEPKGILVIGATSQLDNREKKASFELFRRNLHNPEIITYDELLERARFLVNADDAESSELCIEKHLLSKCWKPHMTSTSTTFQMPMNSHDSTSMRHF